MANPYKEFPGKKKNETTLGQQAQAWADDQEFDIVDAWFKQDDEETGEGNYIIEYRTRPAEPTAEA